MRISLSSKECGDWNERESDSSRVSSEIPVTMS